MARNPFASDQAARRYAEGRPDYSHVVAPIIRRLTSASGRFGAAVDVGSGTGISTMAIASIAEEVVGVEPSPAMIDLARAADNVSYRLGSADHLPLEDKSYDLISVGSALHWFDRERFLAEASRVARSGAWLVVYDHWFAGQMENRGDFGNWVRDVYLAAYPSPPRDRSWRPPEDLGSWAHTRWERYDHQVVLTAAQLATYLLTQSNLQTVIERGDETEDQLRSWLLEELAAFFADDHAASFLFEGFVACHRLQPEP